MTRNEKRKLKVMMREQRRLLAARTETGKRVIYPVLKEPREATAYRAWRDRSTSGPASEVRRQKINLVSKRG